MVFLTTALESRRGSTGVGEFLRKRVNEIIGFALFMASLLLLLILATYDHTDPSFDVASSRSAANVGGMGGAALADILMQYFGLASILVPLTLAVWSMRFMQQQPPRGFLLRIGLLPPALIMASIALGVIPAHGAFGIHAGLGGALGSVFFDTGVDYSLASRLAYLRPMAAFCGMGAAAIAGLLMISVLGLSWIEWREMGRSVGQSAGRGMSRGMERGAGMVSQASRAGSDALSRNSWSKNTWSKNSWFSVLARAEAPSPKHPPAARLASPHASVAVDLGDIDSSANDLAEGDARERAPSSASAIDLPSFMRRSTGDERPKQSALRGMLTLLRPKGDRADVLERRVPVFSGQGGDQSADRGADQNEALENRSDAAFGTLGAATFEAAGPRRMAPGVVAPKTAAPTPGKKAAELRQPKLALDLDADKNKYTLPSLTLLATPIASRMVGPSEESLQQNALLLLGVLEDFGVHGEIVKVRPGPVVTLYELEPAPGTKSSRVIGLADDIARSMSAISVRVAVVPGRNVIGIELPNVKSETVYLRELLASDAYERNASPLPLVLGKDIGGGPVMADLTKMPHLLIAGTTGSGKSVGINTMILSILYRLPPDRCKFIMIDPKMLELSIYDGIPHLLAPVVTDPKKAVVALKWTVREMENRYRSMSKLGVRNIDGYNARLADAVARGETLTRRVQTGFDPETGEPQFEEQELGSEPLPFIVVVVDEMADLMLVAGKEIEGAVQRLAQMARAAGIHIIMATQRPSVDVITGTIKANFPTRISFQVTSKIDSRTILGESGAEQLLGRGDMLYMSGGGRITRVHGPFVSDGEVESIVNHLKAQAGPSYVDDVTEEDLGDAVAGEEAEPGDSGNELYDKAVALVARERKASTSFVQRHLQIGYNRAARIMEMMEKEGVVSTANHVGKREVLAPPPR